MPVKRKSRNESDILADLVAQGMADKKAEKIVSLNLSKIPAAVCNYFVICQGNNRNQVEAIAESVEAKVQKALGAKPWHREGFENAEWILLDYVDVVAHIFMDRTRSFYHLEDLWADSEDKWY
ncbi:MAG: ribosome silencing factor [Bacteroidales bacterium]|nr:ribosome silencing factor [Bacteroidales bacterium]